MLTLRFGGGAFSVVLGGASAGAATLLTPETGDTLGGTPDLLIKTTDSSDWGAFRGLLQINPSTYGLSAADFGLAAQITRESGGHLRLMSYSGGVKLSRVTPAATLVGGHHRVGADGVGVPRQVAPLAARIGPD